MRLFAKVGLIVFLLFAPAVLGCASKKLTPENARAAASMRADAVVVRVNEVQAAVISICGSAPQCVAGGIDTDLARTIVQSCIDLRLVLKTTPDGWQATVKSTWARVKNRFSAVQNPAVLAAVNLLDAAIGGL